MRRIKHESLEVYFDDKDTMIHDPATGKQETFKGLTPAQALEKYNTKDGTKVKNSKRVEGKRSATKLKPSRTSAK